MRRLTAPPRTLDEVLRNAARSAPTALAVVSSDWQLTYAELDRYADAISQALTRRGVAQGDRVAIHAPKSVEAVIAIHGVLRAGAAYVPLDNSAPERRLQSIKEIVAPRAILSSGDAERVRSMAGATPVVDIENEMNSPVATPSAVHINVKDPAYVLFTSGSTGKPKGVVMSHESAVFFASWAANETALSPADRVASVSPFHFDISIFDLFASALGRSCLVLVPEDVLQLSRKIPSFVQRHGINVWYSVPSVMTRLIAYGRPSAACLRSLRLLIFAGETFPLNYLNKISELAPHARFMNWYGPTETNVCTSYNLDPVGMQGLRRVPIGRPLPGVECVVVDDRGSPVPAGTPGELLVRGPCVMSEYWADADQTRLAFVGTGARRAYQTGDQAEVDEQGDLVFLGRRDGQVKRRGYRIELGEIEAACVTREFVCEAAAVAVRDEEGVRIFLFVTLETDATVTSAELSQHIAKTVPRYMVPDRIEVCDSLPRTSSGKIDRSVLQKRAGA